MYEESSAEIAVALVWSSIHLLIENETDGLN
jgi:hypothetical protein